MSPVPRIAAIASHLRVGEDAVRLSGCIVRVLVMRLFASPGLEDCEMRAPAGNDGAWSTLTHRPERMARSARAAPARWTYSAVDAAGPRPRAGAGAGRRCSGPSRRR